MKNSTAYPAGAESAKLQADYTVLQLEQRFDFEDEWLKAGNRLGTKAFYSALRERLVELDGTEKHTHPRQPV